MSNVNNIAQVQPEYHQPEQKKFNVRVLSDDDIKRLPEDEKKELVMMPGEEGSLWEGVTGKEGTTIGWNVPNIVLQRIAPVFSTMLKAIEPTVYSHLAFGEFRFSFSRYNKVFRALYKGTGGGFKPKYTPASKWVENVIFMPPDEINDFLAKEENKGKWEIYGDWKFSPTGNNITVGLYKHQ